MIDNGLYVDKAVNRHTSLLTTTVPTASAVPIASASAKRVRITFGSDGSNVVAIGQQNPLDGNRLFRLPLNATPQSYDVNEYGSWIQGAFFAQANVANVNVSVIDVVES